MDSPQDSELSTRPAFSIGSYSLRMLLVVMTLACVVLAAWRHAIRPFLLQQQAVKQIQDLGGTVRMVPAGSTWLARVVRKEQFYDVVEVDLTSHPNADGYIQWLTQLPRLETLYVGYNFSDIHMRKLQHCTRLRHLHLQRSQITDDGLRICQRFPRLALLLLGRNITDDGLASLKASHTLAYLDLSGTQVTDDGLVHIQALPSLRKLVLNDRPITDTGLRAVLTLPKLDELYLAGCKDLTDESISGLAEFHQLRRLDVARTKARSKTLEKLTNDLAGCRVTHD